MKNSEYWQKRFSLLEESRHNAGADVYKEIERQYQRAKKEIESEISRWYRRLADNNGVSMAEARKWLNSDELKEFKWNAEEYVRYGEEHAISGEWAKELENASAKFHISRLDALKINTRQSVEALYGKQQVLVSDFLGETYKSDYYHTAFELQKGFEIGFDIGKVNDDYLQKVLYKPWAPDGSNFSDRIWANKDKLLNEIHTELTQSILTGADPQKAIDAISHDLDVSKANAGRLVMTESAYFGTLAQQDCFNDLGVEEYEIVATLDDRTSAICQSMDGQHFPMKDFEAGVSAPPFHVNCRSCTCPYFDDEFSLGGERAARDENGEVYYVPADMKYPEWKEAFVDGEHEESRKREKALDLNTRINKEKLSKDALRPRLDALEPDTKVRRQISYAADEILKHRDGTSYEDLAFIDTVHHKYKINKSYDYYEAGTSACTPNDPMYKMWKESEPYTIIGVHNHPHSGAPSLKDVQMVFERKYKYSIVICHKGPIYKFSFPENFTIEKKNFWSEIEFNLAQIEKGVYNNSWKRVESALELLKELGLEMEVGM